MAQCRKCGASPLTRRRAGIHSCKKCGVQPGVAQYDRGGNFSRPTTVETRPAPDYIIKTLSPKGLPAVGARNG